MKRTSAFVIASILLLCIGVFGLDAAQLFTYPKFSALGTTGQLLAGGKLYTYEPGTTTPKTAYKDRSKTTAHPNPIVLDSNGEATIYFDGRYKVVLKDSTGVTKWTMDNVEGIGSFYVPPYKVDALETYGGGTSYTSTTIKAALTAIGTSTQTILVLRPGTWTKVGTDTINFASYPNITVEMEGTFKTSGTGAFSAGDITGFAVSKPEWFATNTTPGTTDMSTAFDCAIQSVTAGGTIDITGSLIYKWDSPITVTSGDIRIVGMNVEYPKIIYNADDGTTALTFSTGANSNIARICLENFRISGFDAEDEPTDGVGISFVDGAYIRGSYVKVEGYRNGDGDGTGIAFYGHTNCEFTGLDVRWCDYPLYFGVNPNAHASGIDVDIFTFYKPILNATPDDDSGTCIKIEANDIHNLTFFDAELSACKYGLEWTKALTTSNSHIAFIGGRLEPEAGPVAGGRFLKINTTVNNLYSLAVRDFYSPYAVELDGNVNFASFDNVYLGDDADSTASLIMGANVGPVGIRNSRITVGITASNKPLWTQAAPGAVLTDGMYVRAAADTPQTWYYNLKPSVLLTDEIDLTGGTYSYTPDFKTYKIHHLRITNNGTAANMAIANPTSINTYTEGTIIIENASGGAIGNVVMGAKYHMAAGADPTKPDNGKFTVINFYIKSNDYVVETSRATNCTP